MREGGGEGGRKGGEEGREEGREGGGHWRGGGEKGEKVRRMYQLLQKWERKRVGQNTVP